MNTRNRSLRLVHCRSLQVLSSLFLATAAVLPGARAVASFSTVTATTAVATGQKVLGADAPGRIVLANEPGEAAGALLEFDLSGIVAGVTPLARVSLDLEKLKVKRPGESSSVERGAMHVFLVEAAGGETLVGSTHLKPGGTTFAYQVDVTDGVNRVLADAKGKKILRLAVRLTGKPISYEVYALPAAKPVLEIASAENWTDNWQRCLVPIVKGDEVYRESCLALTETPDAEVALRTLYPVAEVSEVIALGTGEKLQKGRDWILRDGQIVLPVGSHAPIQLAGEFFLSPRKEKDGTVTQVRGAVKLSPGPWYHERQMAVTYKPAQRDWQWPAALSSLDQLPRTKQLLRGGKPLSVVLFGDSISEGFDGTKKDGVWPYQASFGELVIRHLRRVYGSDITFMNHARAGGTASHATTQVDAQVAWFKPDLVLLAYGMNDRSDARRVVEKENLEKIIDAVRARSPETEFVVITPMLNSPKQPTGLGPIKFIRDQELAIDRPRIAFVDITSTELAMLERKDYLDLSGNGANHPNDFLNRIYAQRILEVLAP